MRHKRSFTSINSTYNQYFSSALFKYCCSINRTIKLLHSTILLFFNFYHCPRLLSHNPHFYIFSFQSFPMPLLLPFPTFICLIKLPLWFPISYSPTVFHIYCILPWPPIATLTHVKPIICLLSPYLKT